MRKLTILLTGLGALGTAFGVVLTANDNVPLGTVIAAAGVLLLSGALGLALRAGRKSASPAEEAPKQVPLRARTDLSGEDNLYPQLTRLAGRVAQHLEGKQLKGKTVTVKARLADFTTFTRQTTLPYPTGSDTVILETAWRLFSRELTPDRAFRLLGVGVSGFTEDEEFQLPLFGEELLAEDNVPAQ